MALNVAMSEYKKNEKNKSTVTTLAISFYNLAVEHEHLNNYKEAFIECRNGLNLCKKELGEMHDLTIKLRKLSEKILKVSLVFSKRSKSALKTPSSNNPASNKKVGFLDVKYTPKKSYMNCLDLELIEEENADNIQMGICYDNKEKDLFKFESMCKPKFARTRTNIRLPSQEALNKKYDRNGILRIESKEGDKNHMSEAKIKSYPILYEQSPTTCIKRLHKARIKLLPHLKKKKLSEIVGSNLTTSNCKRMLYNKFNAYSKKDYNSRIDFPADKNSDFDEYHNTAKMSNLSSHGFNNFLMYSKSRNNFFYHNKKNAKTVEYGLNEYEEKHE